MHFKMGPHDLYKWNDGAPKKNGRINDVSPRGSAGKNGPLRLIQQCFAASLKKWKEHLNKDGTGHFLTYGMGVRTCMCIHIYIHIYVYIFLHKKNVKNNMISTIYLSVYQ